MWKETKVVADDGVPEAWFGSAVAISGDTALVGAKNSPVGSSQSQGVVYEFRRVGTSWLQENKLAMPDGAAGDQAGTAIAVHGKWAVATAPFATVEQDIWRGATYILERVGSGWVHRQKLVEKHGSMFDTFGVSAAISSDFVFIGSGGASHAGQQAARNVHVFQRRTAPSKAPWNQLQNIASPIPDDVTSSFGGTIALSDSFAFVGARSANVSGRIGQGRVFVYRWDGSQWVSAGGFIASDGAARDNFGVAIAVHGEMALVGAPGAVINGNTSQGAVYCMRRSGNRWRRAQKLVASDGTSFNLFGASISVSGDTMIVGAYASKDYRGLAYVFRFRNGRWIETDKLFASDGAHGDVFGYYTAIDGDTALVGAYTAKVGNNAKQGAAYFYTYDGTGSR